MGKDQASLICGSVVAPLEEKTKPLEKAKAPGFDQDQSTKSESWILTNLSDLHKEELVDE